jgi:murein DD-endopeptidase MepM/ murein hydrolase activator NlpD
MKNFKPFYFIKSSGIPLLSVMLFLTACPSRKPIAPIQEGIANPVISDINRQTPLNTKVISNPKQNVNSNKNKEVLAPTKIVVYEQFPNEQKVIINPMNQGGPIEVVIPPVLPHNSIPQPSMAVKVIPVVQNSNTPNSITPTALTTSKNNVLKKYYPVKSQETWYSVSRLHQVSLEQLAQANGITIEELKDPRYQLKVGQTLAIPVIAPTISNLKTNGMNVVENTTPVVAKNGVQKHTVQVQENWYSVARLYKISPVELAGFNQKNVLNDNDLLKVGQVINIPALNSQQSNQVIPQTVTPNTTANKGLKDTTKLATPKFTFPLEGKISSFKVLKNFTQTNNKGIDFATANHQIVQSVAVGKVIYASNQLKDYGNMLMIDHGKDWVSVYAFLDKLLVKEGSSVEQNQAIGLTENKKLHFELRQAEKPVNPLLHLPK